MRATPKTSFSKEGSLQPSDPKINFKAVASHYLGSVLINIPKVTRHPHHWPHNLVGDKEMCVQLMVCQHTYTHELASKIEDFIEY